MGFLEKLKNTFFEEEYVEVEEKPKKEPKPIAKKVETKPKKEEKQVVEPVEEVKVEPVVPNTHEFEVEETDKQIYADKELLKSDANIQYFEDDDFVEVDQNEEKEQETKKLYGGDPSKIYEGIAYTAPATKPYSNPAAKAGFKPTPIISPIYGILDKNYKKEEVVDKKDKPSSYVSRKNVDLDFVRNKAFGAAEGEESSYVHFSETIETFEKEEPVEENLLYDMTESDEAPAVSKVTIADAEEYFEDLGLEYNVDYRDSRYEKATGRRSKITKEEVTDSVSGKTSPETVVDDPKLEDNLFDLIDSMYEEKE